MPVNHLHKSDSHVFAVYIYIYVNYSVSYFMAFGSMSSGGSAIKSPSRTDGQSFNKPLFLQGGGPQV